MNPDSELFGLDSNSGLENQNPDSVNNWIRIRIRLEAVRFGLGFKKKGMDSDSTGFGFEVPEFGFEMPGFAHHWSHHWSVVQTLYNQIWSKG